MNREQKKTFLEQLQSLDAPTKKKVLVTTTVIVIVLVTYVWLGYFNNIIAGISESAVASNAPSVPAAAPETSGGWARFANGAAFVSGEIEGGFQDLLGMFGAPKHYTITPQQ